jgi:hypothetical protein
MLNFCSSKSSSPPPSATLLHQVLQPPSISTSQCQLIIVACRMELPAIVPSPAGTCRVEKGRGPRPIRCGEDHTRSSPQSTLDFTFSKFPFKPSSPPPTSTTLIESPSICLNLLYLSQPDNQSQSITKLPRSWVKYVLNIFSILAEAPLTLLSL